MVLITSFMAYWGSQHILLKTEDWPNLMNFEDPALKIQFTRRQHHYAFFYPRYLMLKTEDLKTASLKSEDPKHDFMCWESPYCLSQHREKPARFESAGTSPYR